MLYAKGELEAGIYEFDVSSKSYKKVEIDTKMSDLRSLLQNIFNGFLAVQKRVIVHTYIFGYKKLTIYKRTLT